MESESFIFLSGYGTIHFSLASWLLFSDYLVDLFSMAEQVFSSFLWGIFSEGFMPFLYGFHLCGNVFGFLLS